MKSFLEYTARRLNRRHLLSRSAAVLFGVFAGAAVGQSPALAAACSGPYGTGSCGGCCRGSQCASCGGGAYCYGVPLCRDYYCWFNSNVLVTCCDCQCRYGSASWYCYCMGGP